MYVISVYVGKHVLCQSIPKFEEFFKCPTSHNRVKNIIQMAEKMTKAIIKSNEMTKAPEFSLIMSDANYTSVSF